MKICKIWTPAEADLLRRQWLAGDSVASIAKALERSKGSIIGKANRDNLPPHADNQNKATRRSWQIGYKPQCTLPGLALADVDRHGCLWSIHTLGTAHRFCGDKVAGHGSYCIEHSALAYKKTGNGSDGIE